MNEQPTKRPRLALVATPRFKSEKADALCQFVSNNLYTLASRFDVVSTGNTHLTICDFMNDVEPRHECWPLIEKDMARVIGGTPVAQSAQPWRDFINSRFTSTKRGVKGMIELANDLVQGKLDAIIQFSVGDDTTVRAGSAVLRREANVHDVPIASDLATARAFVDFWSRSSSPCSPREPKVSPLEGLRTTDRVLALIAHDGRKDEMGLFVKEHAEELRRFRYILATGHSGALAEKSLRGSGWKDNDLDRLRPCNSGPEGGDVEIAAAVIQGLCDTVLFFQDPATSHPHEADIRLFGEAVLEKTGARLATNAQSARILLETTAA